MPFQWGHPAQESVAAERGCRQKACFIFDNKFVLFGDIENLESKEKIIEHLKKYELELVDFKGLEVNDYGGVITF